MFRKSKIRSYGSLYSEIVAGSLFSLILTFESQKRVLFRLYEEDDSMLQIQSPKVIKIDSFHPFERSLFVSALN